MIDFSLPPSIAHRRELLAEHVARNVLREQARYYDEHEHEIPWDYINQMWQAIRDTGQGFRPGP